MADIDLEHIAREFARTLAPFAIANPAFLDALKTREAFDILFSEMMRGLTKVAPREVASEIGGEFLALFAGFLMEEVARRKLEDAANQGGRLQ